MPSCVAAQYTMLFITVPKAGHPPAKQLTHVQSAGASQPQALRAISTPARVMALLLTPRPCCELVHAAIAH